MPCNCLHNGPCGCAKTGLGFPAIFAAPVITAAAEKGFKFGSSVMDLVSSVYTDKKATEQYNREVQVMKEQEEQRKEEQRLALARARGEQKLQLALQISAERRKQQETVMWAIGAVAVGISGFFIFKALRSGTPAKR